MEIGIALIVFLWVVLAAVLYQARWANGASAEGSIFARLGRIGVDDRELSITRETPGREPHFLDALLSRVNLFQKLEEFTWQAGLYLRAFEVLTISVLLLGAGALGGYAWFGDLTLGAGCGILLSLLPLLYIRFRRLRRLRAFGQILPDVFDLLKSSLEAGHTLMRGLQMVVEEFSDPVSSEFRMVLEQTRLGIPLPRALAYMVTRVPEETLGFFVVAVKIQAEVGTSLAQIIARLSETVRNRQRVNQQIRALTAQSRLGAWVVGCLPIIMVGIISMIQPRLVEPLFFDPSGRKLLKIAIGLELMALVTIRRLLKLDY